MARPVPTRAILALLVSAIAVPLAIFAAMLIERTSRQQQDVADQQNLDTARAIMVAIDQEVQKTTTSLAVIASLNFVSAEPTGIAEFTDIAPAIRARQEGWHTLFLLDSTGRRVASTSDSTLFDQPGAATVIHDVLKSGRTGVSDLLQDPTDHRWVYLVALPMLRDGTVEAILAAEVHAQTLSDVLRRQQTPPNGVVTLIDRSRRIMARTRNEETYVGQQPSQAFAAAAAISDQGVFRGQLLEGTPSYSALSKSSQTGWIVGVGLPRDEVDGPAARSLWMLAAAGVLVFVLGLVAAVYFGNLMVRGLDDCATSANALAREEPVRFRSSPIREVGIVAQRMSEAAALRDQRLRERDAAEAERAEAARLRELALAAEQAARAATERNEARLNVTLRSIGDAVIATDASGAITMMNPVAQALTGWTEAAAMGQPIEQVFYIVNEDTRERMENPVSKVFAAGRIVGLANHTLLITRDGREIPIEDSAAPIHGPDRSIAGVVLVFRDNRAKRDEEQRRQDLLLREQRAREEAEAASRAKDEFLATLSHELRTPLNAMLGWTRMLRGGQVAEGARERALEIIERNARVQAQLVDDLLDVSRFVRGHVQVTMATVQLGPIIDAACDAVRPAADAKDIALGVDGLLTDYISGDPGRLQQVFWNLLTNSTKFTPRGGRIDVRVFRDGPDAVAQVADSGQGIPRELLPHVFERFRQGTPDDTHTRAGLGIGLSLVRHIVELHGGTVIAESDGEGLGARFTVRLPIVARAARHTTA